MDRISLQIPFARLDERAVLPTQGSAQAAGWDLYAVEETVVPKGSTVLISTGWATAIPEGWEGQIRCRSSLGKKGMIMLNGLGTIDSDYRGELKVLATWIGEGDTFTVKAGERIAQRFLRQCHWSTSWRPPWTDWTKPSEGPVGLDHPASSESVDP